MCTLPPPLLPLPPALNSSSKARLAATFIMFLTGQPLGEVCASGLFVNNEHAPFKDGENAPKFTQVESQFGFFVFLASV